jgi:hypothetical protein
MFLSSCFEHYDLFVGSRITYPSVSYLSRKVTSEVSVSRRRRSPSARSALPLKVSLARHSDSIIDAVERHESRFGEKLFRGKFWRRGGFPLLDPRRLFGPGPLRRAWLWSSDLPGLPEPWPLNSVTGPKVCFALSVTLFLSPFFILRLKNVVLMSAGFETALNESVKNCKALAEAAEQKEAERVAMSEAISAFCQAFGLDGVPSGSSPQSHLWALSGHVRKRLRGALHHSVRRAFVVLASHYDVDLERVSEGYCLPDEEEAALADVQRLDAAVEGPSATLASSFEVDVFPPVSPSGAVPDCAEDENDVERVAPPPTDV